MTLRPSALSDKWPRVPLGEAVEFLDHRRKPITASDRVAGPYPYYGANGQQDSVAEYLFDEPLILLAEDGGHFDDPSRGVAYGVTGKCWVNNHAHVLRPRSMFDFRFLCWHLAYYDISEFVNGTTRAKLTKSAAEQIPVMLPPLSEQRRIADILDKADAIRRKRKEAITLTEELLRSAFLEMFGDPVTNPKGWPVKALGELGRVTTGRTPPSAAPGMFNGPVPFVTPGDLGSREPVRRSLTVDGARESRVVRAGAALVCCIGATIGKMAKAPNELAFNQQINAIEWHSLVNDDFGITVLRFLKTRIAASASSTTLPILNKSSFEKLEIPVPPVAQQTLFSRRAEVCRKVSEAQEQTLSQADTFFNSLVARAFSGALGSAR
ncbi:MAG: restriction endonuclease subunit S [Deltaproteobacteria bacterium]|nr:restriction endonuclease subunit S [Deltaproteobacteria bacterium]